MARDTFEIYYHQNGRWSVHASFESGERELALAEAQKVDKTLGFPVRLVRETFYPETNTSEEVVSWQSAKAKQMGDPENMFGGAQGKAAAKPQQKQKPKPPAPVQTAPRRVEKPEAAPAAPTPAPRKVAKKAAPPPKRKSKGKSRGLTRKVVKVVVASLAITMAFVVAAGFIMNNFQLVAQEDSAAVGAGIFVVSYAISAIYFLFKEFDIQFGWQRRRKARAAADAAAAPRPTDMIRKMRVASIEAADNQVDVDVSAMAQTNIDDLRENIEQADAEDVADRMGDDDFATAVHEEPEAVEPQPAEAPAVPEPPKAAEKPPEAPPPPKPPEKKAPEKPPEPSPDTQNMLAFARDALGSATREQPQLNAFSRFGLNLYVAGACNAMGQAKRLPKAAQLAMLREGLIAAGNTPERAESFIGELASHGKNPRYAAMIQSGGSAMGRQLGGQRAGTEELTALLGEWSKPEKRPSVPSAYTFMFTDIVNSTALTSQLGNAGAQRVVRAHNTAVRGAIQAYQGREVKHTGDGIMATFPSPIAAVQASIRAQKELVAHNASNPGTAFTIRIGLNVGEAVEEDNDFFGSSVQMTARVCSVCTPANAWVTRAIVDACKGQRVGFIPRGAFQMKGIQQARPLYEIAYTEAHKEEIANL